VLLPNAAHGSLVLPALSDEGRYVWPPDDRRPTMRTYTVRRFDAEADELDIDFVLHGEHGVASAWAARTRPGDEAGVIGPGGRTVADADWYLLAGDQTALPAISVLLESLPRTARGHAYIEIPDPGEKQRLTGPPRLDVTWLQADGHAPAGETPLVRAVRHSEWPSGDRVFAWASGESAMVRTLRRHLTTDRGTQRGSRLVIGYWKHGLRETAYHDRHHNDRED